MATPRHNADASDPAREITEVTRRNLFGELLMNKIDWAGRLDEPHFLSRIFDLTKLPSTDSRTQYRKNAWVDIHQHRVNNTDWEDDWILTDPRFYLLHCEDRIFLQFLSEMLHPVVRPDADEVVRILEIINRHLKADGWELFEQMNISGRPVFAARALLDDGGLAISAAQGLATELNAAYITQQVTRLESGVCADPSLAIGTAKEFVETVCKTILTERGVSFDKGIDFPPLVRLTLGELSLVPDAIPAAAKAADTVRRLLQNLATISNGLAELRNPYGTGHGKEASAKGLQLRHARLAVHAATALAVFLFETHKERPT